MTSPKSGPKSSIGCTESFHIPMKCGYICKNCKETHIWPEKLLGTTCKFNGGQHDLLKRAVMCQNCDELSDCAMTFAKKPCHGRRPQPSAKAPANHGSKDSLTPEQANRYMDLRLAEMEMNRLLLMKELENERMKLQEYLAAKHSTTEKTSSI